MSNPHSRLATPSIPIQPAGNRPTSTSPTTSATAFSTSPRPPTSASNDPPTPRPSQLPFPQSIPSSAPPPFNNPLQSQQRHSYPYNDDTTTVTTGSAGLSSVPTQHPPPHTFLPFFTLIQDTPTSSHFHPTVRYVFSDDEFDPVSILAPTGGPGGPGHWSGDNSLQNSNSGGGNSGSGSQADVDSVGSGHGGAPSAPASTGGKVGRVQERVVLVDVAADGEGILSAHSLSPEWQVSGVKVSKAPTWMSDDSGPAMGGDGGQGLMLTIEGVGRKTGRKLPVGLGVGDRGGGVGAGGGDGKGGLDGLEELVAVYREQLEKLQSVVDWADGKGAAEEEVVTHAEGGQEGLGWGS